MRVNEYNSIEEFKKEYIGVWGPSDGHWFGLDFLYCGNEYRFETGSMYEDSDNVGEDGVVHQFGIYKKTERRDPAHPEIMLYELLFEADSVEEILESVCIDGVKFKEVIMDDDTKILGKD